MQFSQLALGTTALTKPFLCIVNESIVLGDMIQPNINDLKENHEFSADACNWAKLSDQERRQLLWNIACNCSNPFMGTNRRCFASQVRIKCRPEQLQQALWPILVKLTRDAIHPCGLTVEKLSYALLQCLIINQSTEQRHCSKRYLAKSL